MRDNTAGMESTAPSAAVTGLTSAKDQVALHPAPTTSDRVSRLAWTVTWALLARWTPVPLHGWRRLLLRIFGARIGADAVIYPSARVWAPWNLVMHSGSCLAEGADCYNVATVTIGTGAIVSQRAYLCTAGHDLHRSDFPLIAGPISIGAGAWVAAEAFVGPGVTIGERGVAAARAVVVHSVGPDEIVASNPAKVIGRRKREAAT